MVVYLQQVSRQNAGEVLWTSLADGNKLFEGFVRQCKHCQFTWTYKPGSGRVASYCKNCDGFICHKPSCQNFCYPAEQFVEDVEAIERGNRAAIEALVRKQQWREAIFH